jgi:hypothetical protein
MWKIGNLNVSILDYARSVWIMLDLLYRLGFLALRPLHVNQLPFVRILL